MLFTIALAIAMLISAPNTNASKSKAQPSSTSEINMVKTSDLKTAQSSYYHHYPGGGNRLDSHPYYQSDIYDNHGHRYNHKHNDNLGYRNNHGYRGDKGHRAATYGSYGNNNALKYFDKGGANAKGKHFNKLHKGNHLKTEQGNKGFHSGKHDHLNKEHKDKGYKNVHHKEEYGFSKVFEDDAAKKHYRTHHNDFDGFHKLNDVGGFKGYNFLDDQHHGNFGLKNANEKDLYHDVYKHRKAHFGDRGNYGLKNAYANNGDYGFGNNAYGNYGYGNNGYGNNHYGHDGYGNGRFGNNYHGLDAYRNNGYGNNYYGQDGYRNNGYGNNYLGHNHYGNDGLYEPPVYRWKGYHHLGRQGGYDNHYWPNYNHHNSYGRGFRHGSPYGGRGFNHRRYR